MWTKLGTYLWRGTKAIAAGHTQASLGAQSPHLPGAVVRIGRFLFTSSGLWVTVCWYSGYVNKRTEPGSGPTLIVPGTKPVINNDPARAERKLGFLASFTTGKNNSATTGSGGPYVVGSGANPFPGGIGSRLDQGFDLTASAFNAPDDSTIIYSVASDPGWEGGGLVAGRLTAGPKRGMVWYMAEGIRPTVQVGTRVAKGGKVGVPSRNPYNGINGNIEAGWANPGAPSQPLAQVHSNPAGVAWDFYNYIRSLGGPKATSTGGAGHG